METTKIHIALALVVLSVGASVFLFNPKSVKIDERHFSCTEAEPFGIEARCVQYTWVKGVR